MIGKNLFKNKNKMSNLITLFVYFITMICILFLLNFIITDANKVQINIVNNISNDNIKNFTAFFEKINIEANTNIKNVSSNIENAIKREYDLDKLKKELDNNNYSNLSHLIFPYISNIYLNDINTDGNSLFVATSKGIICDCAFSYMNNIKYKCNNHKYRTWQNFIDSSYNKELSKNAIDNLINKNYDIIFCQYKKPTTNFNIDYSKITSDNIAEYYNKYGADIFKDVDMLVPTYITNNGDIFGQNDTDQGIRYDNYKLIVIQRINLYEQIKHNYPNLITNNYMKNVDKTYNRIMCCVYIAGLIVTIVIILIIVQLCNNYNKVVITDSDSKSKNSKN